MREGIESLIHTYSLKCNDQASNGIELLQLITQTLGTRDSFVLWGAHENQVSVMLQVDLDYANAEQKK